jgi:integrase
MWDQMREGARPVKRHPRQALTARTVQSLLSRRDRPRRVADGGGLYLVFAPSGSASWVLRTVVLGRRADIGLGGADVVTLAEAREHAYRLRKIARSGGDPLAARRRERRAVPTFQAAAEQYHATLAPSFRNEKHRRQWLASLGVVSAVFGAKRVDAVTSADILDALKPRWLTRPETSRRVLQRVRAVLEWCSARGFREKDNPAVGVIKVLPKHRAGRAHHAALPYADLPEFIKVLRRANAGAAAKLALEFSILCAARTSETLLATWSEIDLDSRTWTIPAIRMKAGVEHRVPLADRCIEILASARSLSNGGPYVFPRQSARTPMSNMVFLMLLRRMKLPVTTHGFRSTFRDWAAERTNFSRAVCEAALAHTLRDKTEAAYHRTDLFERRRELMGAWAAFAAPSSGSDAEA